jgi:hypothetical protein
MAPKKNIISEQKDSSNQDVENKYNDVNNAKTKKMSSWFGFGGAKRGGKAKEEYYFESPSLTRKKQALRNAKTKAIKDGREKRKTKRRGQ